MSENTVETTTNGPSLESILWGAAERWSDEPGLVDREEFADYIFEAWGGDSPTEDFVARFFDGDPTVARPNDMAEAMSRASRRTMHVYNFDLNRLEYVVIEDAEQVVLVSEQGQFALPNDDYFMRAIERAIIPDSKDPVGTNGQFDRKQDGTPRAYFVRQSGEIVAVDVDQLSEVVKQKQLELKPVFSPVIDDAENRLFPFDPVRTAMMPNREVDLLRQDERISSWTMPSRKRLVSPVEQGMLSGTKGLTAPATADAAVLLLLPDGTLARPVIGSGSRWRDMVSDWTARAAMISLDATSAPDAVMDDRRYAIQTDRVVAIFSGVRPTSDWSDAPGSVGLSTQSRGETIAAVRMLEANIQTLGDDDLAQAILGGAQFVSGLAAPIMADTRPGTGFWMQPEIFFQPSSDDQAYAAREMDLRANGYTNAALETALASPPQDLVAQGATDDAWSNWALQSGGALDPAVATALIGRDVDGGTISGPPDPSTMALFARRGRMVGSAGDDSLGLGGGPLRIPSDRVAAFRAPDGTIVYQGQANTQVRFASAQRLVGSSDDTTPYSLSSDDPTSSAPTPRSFTASIGNRSGALPATALAALATALDRTAAASGYKLPRMVSVETADDAIFTGEAMSSTLSEYSSRRTHAALMDSPFMSGTVGRMVLSMPFPTAADVFVGPDLDEALQAWMTSPAISVDSGMNGSYGAFGGAAGGSIAGDAALRGGDFSSGGTGSPTYNSMGPSLLNAALVSGSLGASGLSQPDSTGSDPSSTSGLTAGSFNTSGSSGTTDFGSNPALAAAASSGSAPSSSSGAASTGLASPGSVPGVSATVGGSSSGGTNYLVRSPATAAGSSTVSAAAFADGSFSNADLGSLHGAALGRAQNASLILQMPAAAETLSSRSTLARLPKLLARALESSGGWIPGAGTPLPNAVREFALSSPFDLPELAAIGAFPQDDGPGLISTRVLNPGEEEISIPMPLWAQMGRGRLSTTEAIMASPRMRPGFAPPLGVYRLVSPEMVDLTGGAPASTPGIVTLQGPVEMGLQQSLAGGVEASKMGGQFTLGRIPIADGESVVTRRGRIRIGAPLGSDDSSMSDGGLFVPGAGSSADLSSFGQVGSFASEGIGAAGTPALEGIPSTGATSLTSSSFSSSAMLGGDAPTGTLVTSGPNVLRAPAIPDIQTLQMQEDLASSSMAPSSSGRPFAGALRSALRMSDEVDSRMMPGSVGSSGLSSAGSLGSVGGSSGAFSGASSLGSGPSWGSLGSSSSLVGQPMFGSGGGIASGVAGPEFGGVSSLVSGAPQGSLVAGGGSNLGEGSLSALSSGADASSSGSLVSSAVGTAGGGSSGSVAGLPPGAWSGATRADGGYTPWTYGSRFSPSEQNRGGVDFYSGSRLNKPNYPSLPAMLRFRYIGAPLWWTSATGSFGAGTDSDGPSSNTMARSLRSGLSAANSAGAIWRSIFVAPGRQDDQSAAPGSAGATSSNSSDAGAIDQTWDRNADSMASLSSRMTLIASGVGAGVAGTAGSAGTSLSGPETVYVAMDSAGRAGTATAPSRQQMNQLNMRIVAAIPPSPPPLADMASASSTNVEARPRHSKAGGQHGSDDEKSGDQGTSRSKIEGSVDAIAQRIYHRIVRRLDSDRERFGG